MSGARRGQVKEHSQDEESTPALFLSVWTCTLHQTTRALPFQCPRPFFGSSFLHTLDSVVVPSDICEKRHSSRAPWPMSSQFRSRPLPPALSSLSSPSRFPTDLTHCPARGVQKRAGRTRPLA